MKSNWLSDAANETADAVLEEFYERFGYHYKDYYDHEAWSDVRTHISDIIRHTLVTEARNAARATCAGNMIDLVSRPAVCDKCGATEEEELCKLDWEESL